MAEGSNELVVSEEDRRRAAVVTSSALDVEQLQGATLATCDRMSLLAAHPFGLLLPLTCDSRLDSGSYTAS